MIIGDQQIGAGCPPVYWPDIDLYFKGDIDLGQNLIEKIAAAGGRFVKGAVFQRNDLCLDCADEVSYFDPEQGLEVHERYRDVVARHVVSLDDTARLYAFARDIGMSVVMSVYDTEGADFAVEMGAVAIKIPSSNIVHESLIHHVANIEIPIILDTGRSNWDEIERAVGWACDEGAGTRSILQHSPPAYPAPLRQSHLKMIPHMSAHFGLPTGLSDHHRGTGMIPLAIGLGACVIEKGLCADNTKADLDIAHALEISQLKPTFDLVEDSWIALGNNVRPGRLGTQRPIDRMGLIAARSLDQGERLDRAAIGFAFPTHGIAAEDFSRAIAARVHRPIAQGQPITWWHLDVDCD